MRMGKHFSHLSAHALKACRIWCDIRRLNTNTISYTLAAASAAEAEIAQKTCCLRLGLSAETQSRLIHVRRMESVRNVETHTKT
jgi:hypothetical protein